MEWLIHVVLQIIGFACLGHIMADFLNNFEKLPDRPFKCNMCLSFWISLVPFIFIYEGNGILYAATASIVSELIFRKLT